MRLRISITLLIPLFLLSWAVSSGTVPRSTTELAPGSAVSSVSSLSVGIVGDEDLPPDEECAWVAIVGGGTAPYSYNWWGALTGSTRIIEGSLSESSYLWVEVTDALSQVDTAQILIWIDEEYDPCEWK